MKLVIFAKRTAATKSLLLALDFAELLFAARNCVTEVLETNPPRKAVKRILEDD